MDLGSLWLIAWKNHGCSSDPISLFRPKGASAIESSETVISVLLL
jgi:hypothetical protein